MPTAHHISGTNQPCNATKPEQPSAATHPIQTQPETKQAAQTRQTHTLSAAPNHGTASTKYQAQAPLLRLI